MSELADKDLKANYKYVQVFKENMVTINEHVGEISAEK